MVVSELHLSTLKEYLRIAEASHTEDELLAAMREAACSYVRNYTGVTNLDMVPEFTTAVLVLIQDMWDTRAMYVTGEANRVVESILAMHATNYLPSVEAS